MKGVIHMPPPPPDHHKSPGSHEPHYPAESGPKPKHHEHHDIPPHILKEIFDLKEKVGKLEGMIEVLLRQK